ncbi:hemin ABC transporter substrate-binding protein [Rhizobium helianthi]|uniref:Hemin ABC transporter substrate-binding protein n=1 Tax=Rhizobium helianthi TaxID=1132695 RepID=A0ABW4M0W5_9HYPH
MPRFELKRLFGIAALMICTLCQGAVHADDVQQYPQSSRIVSVGGTITEILYALDAQDRIVAVDATSIYPASAREKPDIGYIRALSPEGIIAQNPDLILLQEGAGPADALAVLRTSGIPIITIKSEAEADSISRRIRDVGLAVGLKDKADSLATQVARDITSLLSKTSNTVHPRKRVLFVLSLANGRVMVGGHGTEAGALIEMAGGVNAADQINGYKPMTDEAVIAAKPDFVLVMQSGNHHLTPEQVFQVPALASSPAATNKALLSMDALLLTGFGPRTPEAIRLLHAKLYGGSQ